MPTGPAAYDPAMPSPSTITAFTVTAVLFVLFPGPAMLFLVARGVAGGPRVGALSALGVETANAVYVVATALSLTAILAASTVAFTAVRYAGAAYLVYLGIRTLRDRNDPEPPAVARGSLTAWTSWRQGFLVGIGNPKAVLFFLAFFPQFVDPDAGSAALQIVFFGLVFVCLGLVTDSAYALLAGTAGNWLRSSLAFFAVRRWVSGTVFIGLGVAAALSGSRQQH